jgi:LysM domain
MVWQSSSYSIYNEMYESAFIYIASECGLDVLTTIPPAIVTPSAQPTPMCLSNLNYTIQTGDTCNSIALAQNVTSASILTGNPTAVNNCSALIPGDVICLPLTCGPLYELESSDTCASIESSYDLASNSLRQYNPCIDFNCDNLQVVTEILGSMICLGAQGATFANTNSSIPGAPSSSSISTGLTQYVTLPPANSTVANGTTQYCGIWYTAVQGDTCAMICTHQSIPSSLFLQCNPALSSTNCDASLVTNTTYCVGPSYHWNDASFWDDDSTSSNSTITTTTSIATTPTPSS